MNKGKNGRPYIYPNSFIQYCALMYAFLHLPYRQLRGFLQALSGFIPGLRSANYTTLWERISQLDLNVPIPENDIVVAVDSTGIKVTNRGDWMREIHGVQHKGWIKVHIALDVETRKPVAFETTDDRIATLLIGRRIYKIVRRLNPRAKMARFTQLRWSNIFSESANNILTAVLQFLGLDTSLITAFKISMSEALDPHVSRRRFTEEWWA
jgi:hypothetical protein